MRAFRTKLEAMAIKLVEEKKGEGVSVYESVCERAKEEVFLYMLLASNLIVIAHSYTAYEALRSKINIPKSSLNVDLIMCLIIN